jgi:CubicO group peptidase (beta-lactamase class C family)
MDPRQFDRLVTTCVEPASRRGALAMLLSLLGALLSGPLAAGKRQRRGQRRSRRRVDRLAIEKKKKGKKKKGKKPKSCTVRNCASGICCKGVCCPEGQTCQDNVCAKVACPEGQLDCGAGCAARECCTANECAGAQCHANGTCAPHLADDDAAFIRQRLTAFMDKYDMPGASLAIMHEGRLVFAQGYGLANPAKHDPVRIDHLFRIASLSKPFTAVTIFRLIEDGLLSLEDTVFGAGGILGTTFGSTPFGPNIEQITVQHLLEHTSGWALDPDPTFGHLNLSQAQLISWVLDNEPLTYTPGTTYVYLNIGYMVLGRVIERVTGQNYQTAVQQHTLTPSGITDMHIAGDTLAQRRANEVVYTPQGEWSPYTFRISRQDAHGGWIASASDLARLLVRVDSRSNRPDILSSTSLATMATETTAREPDGARPYYSKGWGANDFGNLWHFGAQPGTLSTFMVTTDGDGWVALFNSRDEVRLNQSTNDLDDLLWSILDGIQDWPDIDLF